MPDTATNAAPGADPGAAHDGAAPVAAVLLALRQIAHPSTLRLVAQVAALTLLLFAALGAFGWLAVTRWGAPLLAPWIDADTAGGLAILAAVLASWLLFRSAGMAVMGLFTDGVIAAVEADHYPAAARAAVPVPFSQGLRLGLRAGLRSVGWNLAALPLYLVLLVTGIGPFVLLLILNAVLLARDFEAMVAARHPDLPPRLLGPMRRWTLGLASSALFMVPVVNLAAPVFGAALAVHLLHTRPKGV